MAFIGRKQELAFLESCYQSPNSQLVVLYGRRRVGKTETLIEFAKNKQHLFFAAQSATKEEQLASFSAQMFAYGAPAAKYITQYSSWENALADIANLPSTSRHNNSSQNSPSQYVNALQRYNSNTSDIYANTSQEASQRSSHRESAQSNNANTSDTHNKTLVIIDEFPYLVQSDPSLPSVLQNLWDHVLKNTNIMLVLCGSAMSFIEKEILSQKAPLYGRTTGILKMRPMPYWDAIQFVPNYSPQDALLTYAALGGIPQYLQQFDPNADFATNIKQHILQRGASLYSETEFLMRQEFRETATYNSIVQAIALGATSLNEIAQKTLMTAQKTHTYLNNLLQTDLVEREFSVDAKVTQRSKTMRGLYKLNDNFFRFWYAFVFPNRSNLEAGDLDGVYQYDIEPLLHTFAAPSFEQVCADWMRQQNIHNKLPMRAKHIGRWWNKKEEIDVVAADADWQHIVAAECKFTNQPIDMHILQSLQRKSLQLPVKATTQLIQQPASQEIMSHEILPSHEIQTQQYSYWLFSVFGFTDQLKQYADEHPEVRLIDAPSLFICE